MLPKNERISDNQEIKGILKRRKIHLASPLLSLIGEENKKGKTRLTVSCSSKIGGAVLRNRTRRVLIASYQKIRHKMDKNYNIVLLPRQAFNDLVKAQEEIKGFLEKL